MAESLNEQIIDVEPTKQSANQEPIRISNSDKEKHIYADGVNKLQFNSGNLKLSFFESEDVGDNKIIEHGVVKMIMPIESAIKLSVGLTNFLNKLIQSKQVEVKNNK